MDQMTINGIVFSEKFIRNFWGRVDADKNSSCWNWHGYIGKRGYGNVTVDGRTVRVHRVSWMLANGDISEGMYICHHCDNRKCVRPSHLFMGTALDNMLDMTKKRRNHTKITKEDVIEIRRLYSEGIYSRKELVSLYPVSKTHINGIIRGVKWKWLLEPIEESSGE